MAGWALALLQRCLLRCLFYHRLLLLFLAFFYAEWNGIPTGWAWGVYERFVRERVSVFSQQDDTPFFIMEVMELGWDTYRDGR